MILGPVLNSVIVGKCTHIGTFAKIAWEGSMKIILRLLNSQSYTTSHPVKDYGNWSSVPGPFSNVVAWTQGVERCIGRNASRL